MSTLKSINVVHPSSVTNNIVNDASGNVAIGNNLTVAGSSTVTGNETVTGTLAMGSSFKRNRIINGNMLIDQRNAGASVTTQGYTLDRWFLGISQASKLTLQQNAGSVTPPAGFTKYLGITSSSAYSVTATDGFVITQPVEGYNVADLAWGTASAAAVVLSFWVRSSLTGTFGGAAKNSANTRSYPFTYTISAANTWEYKTVSISGDTTGTWVTDNGIGVQIKFGLGVGSTYSGTAGAWASTNYDSATGAVSVVGTSGATFYITGVQLEVGTKATPYEMQIYSDQLAQCMRYYETQDWQINAFHIAIVYQASDSANMYQAFAVPKRATPSITWSSNGSGRYISTTGSYSSVTIATSYATTATGTSVNSIGPTYSLGVGWLDSFGTMKISAEL